MKTKNSSPFLDDRFSERYYDHVMSGRVNDLTWMGVPIVKCPMDLLSYQEILFETKPDLIVETGAFLGGSSLFFAHMCDLLGHGQVCTVELNTGRELPEHPRLEYLLGMSSTDPVVVSHVARRAERKRTMVVLDSAHGRAHVLAELKAYAPMVSTGCYLIVEDTNVHGYRFAPGDILQDGGPTEAIKEFNPTSKGFECDRSRERFLMSFNPAGFYRRVRR